jgi:DNA repair ATPase RecN
MNVKELIKDNVGKKSILITGMTGTGKSELVKALKLELGDFDSMSELRTQEDFKQFRENAPIVAEIHISALEKNLQNLGEYIGVRCYKTEGGQYHAGELDLEWIK